MAGACLVLSLLPTSGETEINGRPVGHWTAVLPPILAITVAVTFRTLVWALLSAFTLGSVLTFGINPVDFIPGAAVDFMWANFTNQFQVYIFGFLFCLVGLIHVTYASGGIQAMVDRIAGFARTRRSAQAVTFFAGLAVFFDDYSNTVVVGNTMRELTDRYKISREKLAYLVDSTTAPIAGLALVSTWIAFEVFLLGSAARTAGVPLDGYAIFFAMLPFRFYCWGTLTFLVLTFLLQRELGPMLKAERRAIHEGKLLRDGARPLVNEKTQARAEAVNGHALHAVFPILLVIVTLNVTNFSLNFCTTFWGFIHFPPING
jgi:Na+/H+ antiporter NhaC